MKIIVQKYDKHSKKVIARNLKTAIRTMNRVLPMYKYDKTIEQASSLSGNLGIYIFEKCEYNE